MFFGILKPGSGEGQFGIDLVSIFVKIFQNCLEISEISPTEEQNIIIFPFRDGKEAFKYSAGRKTEDIIAFMKE